MCNLVCLAAVAACVINFLIVFVPDWFRNKKKASLNIQNECFDVTEKEDLSS